MHVLLTKISCEKCSNAVDGRVVGDPIAKTYFQDRDGDSDGLMTYHLPAGKDR